MIICCGEALMDLVQIPLDKGQGFLPLPGGSSFNTAVAIGRLGVPVQFLGKISTDFFGDIIIKHLRDNNVGDKLIVRTDANTTLAVVNIGENQAPRYAFYTDGTSVPLLISTDLPSVLPAESSCIVFGSISMTMEPVASTIETFIGRYQADHSPVVSFDPNVRPFKIKDKEAYLNSFEKCIAASTIVKLSAEDYAFVYPGFEPEQVLRKILSLGPRLAICTMGSSGAMALLHSEGNVIRVSAPAVETAVVDTVGAGDTFHGALLSWLETKGKLSRPALAGLSETELYNALCFANKAASIVCSRRGADPPAMAEIPH
ncbi:MAG: carbohydrate kinase [Treponema sp.]|nr:carbohydrate kinase [Treponema sp.]